VAEGSADDISKLERAVAHEVEALDHAPWSSQSTPDLGLLSAQEAEEDRSTVTSHEAMQHEQECWKRMGEKGAESPNSTHQDPRLVFHATCARECLTVEVKNADEPGVNSAAIASRVLEALARDNTVLECNMRDYGVSLQHAVQEVLLLRTEIAQLEDVCKLVSRWQAHLGVEVHRSKLLWEENNQLRERHQELVAVIQEAAEASDDQESMTLIQGLITENNVLRRTLLCSDLGGGWSSAEPLQHTLAPIPRRASPERRGHNSCVPGAEHA